MPSIKKRIYSLAPNAAVQYSHLMFYSTMLKMGLFRSEGMTCRWSHKSSNTGNGDYHNYFATLQAVNGITP